MNADNNNVRITAEIERLNEERESNARRVTRDIIYAIANTQVEKAAAIKSCDERLAGLRKQLREVSFEPVNAADIIG